MQGLKSDAQAQDVHHEPLVEDEPISALELEPIVSVELGGRVERPVLHTMGSSNWQTSYLPSPKLQSP